MESELASSVGDLLSLLVLAFLCAVNLYSIIRALVAYTHKSN